MYKIKTTHQFEKDLLRCKKRGYPMDKLRKVIQLLEQNGSLPSQYRPHVLQGNRAGQWECHIQPDWLLIWKQYNKELELLLLNTGTHSDLF